MGMRKEENSMVELYEKHELECPKTCREIKVPTDDEVEALNMLRAIKKRAGEIKGRISELSHSQKTEDRTLLRELTLEMNRLKGHWRDWDIKRKAATRERMILLGHEEAS